MRHFMRSVYAKILMWCFGTLLASLAAFVLLSMAISFRTSRPFFESVNALQMDEAVHAYESGGQPELAAYLQKLHRLFHAEHHLTDNRLKDLVTGMDLSALAARRHGGWTRMFRGGDKFVFTARSPDGRYRLVVEAPPPLSPLFLAPYYLPILAAVAIICWVLAVNIASPLGELTRVVHRFGSGDLAARVNSKRRDEIGEVARAFDQMADRIENLRKSERQLLQDISHELRSPLARLSFANELTKTAADRNAAAARVKKEIDRLTSLVGGLLEITRAEGEASSRGMQTVSLAALAQEVVNDCQLEASARNCRIVFENDHPAQLRGNSELLRRAIENVVRNAIRYAPEASVVEVKLDADEARAAMSIRDYGPGVPEDALPKLFKPFFRVDSSRNSETGGIGLGLAIAHRALTLHHGDLAARNAGPGLLVTMTIPIPGT